MVQIYLWPCETCKQKIKIFKYTHLLKCQREVFLIPSEYVTLIITVPETHAERMREVLGRAGAGKVGEYSHCSFSVKGTGRFMPSPRANPHIGKQGVLEEVVEERIEAVCAVAILEHVLKEIKKAHPYEETVIDMYPVYEIGRKKAGGNHS